MSHFGSKFGCGTRGLHQHLNKIYYKVSEARIVKVTKESTARGQMRPIFSNKGPKKIIQAKQVFERVQVDLVDLSLEVCHHLECIFREHGTPSIIQTDQGTEFKGVFDELCSKRNIRHIRSRAYHPESQGKIERLNRSWKNKMVYDMLINGNENWVTNLSLYSETYNQSKHRGLGNFTPFFVYFGREAVVKGGSNAVMNEEEDENTYIELDYEEPISGSVLINAIEMKEQAKEEAHEKIQLYYDKQKSIYQKQVCAISYNVGGYDELKKVNNENHLMKNFDDTSDDVRFEIPCFYPETSDELQSLQYKEMRRKCVACDPAVPNNGGTVIEGNLRFIFVATCTLDYFLSFMRLAFLTYNSFRYVLESAAQRDNIVAQTLLKMEPSLHKLDWDMARFIWSKMIGVVDKALKQQHGSEKNTFGYLKVRVP
ncbi:unnamed protein product [Rotaria sp. Silwood1]|nr:unnamed protein product [Rotaria sp. Silwood1]CAF4867987.1 unnamed protein product [Rotaria sp. Silwood1]CAF4923302.1 unnamed protein product [Rotaria sp. Silwood1]